MNATPQKRGRAALIGIAIIALAAGAVTVGFHSASAADDHGNTTSTATPINLGVPVLGTLDSFSDKDYFVLQGAIPPSPMRVIASGQAFVPHVEVFDGRGRRIAILPGAGTEMQGPFAYTSALPRNPDGPLYLLVMPAGRIGSYQLVLTTGTGGGLEPVLDPGAPPTSPDPGPGLIPPTPPPGPPSPTDDVPTGSEVNLTATLAFDGHIEIPGDTDAFLYVVPLDGAYEFKLISTAIPDAVADAVLPLTFHVNSWSPIPYVDTFVANTEVRLSVHSLSEGTGAYRIEIKPPPGITPPAPPGPLPPVPPVPPGPTPPAPPGGDVLLPFDPVGAMLPKAAKEYKNWVSQTYRLTDPSVNGEVLGALALRDRWIQLDNGVPRLKTANGDPTGAIVGALAPFGGTSAARTKYPNWLRTQAALVTPGGGSLADIRALIAQANADRRPLLLIGKHQGDGLLEGWVVFGIKTIGGVPNLVVIDPSTPGQTLYLPMGPAGLLPVGSGGALIKSFLFQGFNADIIYP